MKHFLLALMALGAGGCFQNLSEADLIANDTAGVDQVIANLVVQE